MGTKFREFPQTPRGRGFSLPICVVHHWARAVGLINCVIYEINHVLIGMRPEMAVKFGFTK